MEFAPPNLDIAQLKRKVDMSGLTLHIAGENVCKKGRFYMLWRDGNFIVIQAEPWWRPDFDPDITLPMSHFMEEHRALWYLEEVIQTMLDTIVFDGEHNWAYLVRLKKSKTYRLVYKKRELIHNCPIWTKVVELDDIELTRFASGLCWEGIYQEKEVDVFIAWQDDWGEYISAESRGQKLVHSRGVGHYFFDLEAHVSKNGVIVGIMKEALVGRCVTPADRSAVFAAVADIQRHGIFFSFEIYDIYITERGVRFANASNAKYYQDYDALAEVAQLMWTTLADIFNHMEDNPWKGQLAGSRSMGSSTFVIPRLPSPSRPIKMTQKEAIIRWIWSIAMSDELCHFQSCAFAQLYALHSQPERFATRRRDKWIKGDSRTLLPPDNFSGELEASVETVKSVDGPLVASCFPVARYHPYARPTSKRLLLPREPDPVAPTV